MTTLLTDIEAFLDRHAMAPTAFGALFGDRHFVRQLRGGRWVRPATEAKARKAMDVYERDHGYGSNSDVLQSTDGKAGDRSTLRIEVA